MFIGVLTAGLGMAAASIAPAFSQTARTGRATTAATVGEGAKIQESNEWTVGIAGGLLEGTNIRFAAEMAKVLDDRPNLRVLPMVTYGALGNIEDLLYLKGVDVTITSADVLDEFIRKGTLANIKNRLRYICSFYINEVHVYVRPEIKTLEDLAGCATDDLLGYYEVNKDKERVRVPGCLEGFNLTSEDANAIIMRSRIKAGWIEESVEEPAEEEVEAGEETEA